jgi:hypothetical protein
VFLKFSVIVINLRQLLTFLLSLQGRGEGVFRGACPELYQILRYAQNDRERGTQNDRERGTQNDRERGTQNDRIGLRNDRVWLWVIKCGPE